MTNFGVFSVLTWGCMVLRLDTHCWFAAIGRSEAHKKGCVYLQNDLYD